MGDFRLLPTDLIREPSLALRQVQDEGRFQELVRSIQTVGLLQPVGVVAEGDYYRVVFGHRRFLAHRFLGRREVQCSVLAAEEVQALEQATAENVVRQDLSPVEEAQAIRRMIEVQGRTVRDVSSALGKSESWVRARLELLLWPEAIVEAVGTGALPVAVARELVLVEDPRTRGHYLGCALESGCTAVQMRHWREEWELQRTLGNDAPALAPPSELPPAPIVPHCSCAMCEKLFPIVAVQFLRVCEVCVLELRRAKWEAMQEAQLDRGAPVGPTGG